MRLFISAAHRGNLLAILIIGWASFAGPLPESNGDETLRVMSFNIWVGGDAGGQPLEQTVAVIKAARADIVGLQETAGQGKKGEARPDHAEKIARKLNWHYFDQGGRTGIISRYKIVSATPGKWGVKVMLPSGQPVYVFNAHFAAAPYQPYQLLRIPYHKAPFLTTESEAIQAALATRGKQVTRLLADLNQAVSKDTPVFLTGDFNEPSHLDWTTAAMRAKCCPLKVNWPTTSTVTAAGFRDTWREAHPDPVKHRGLTWTPITNISDPKDRHDRIDFVFARPGHSTMKVLSAETIGESKEFADIVVTPYPSDHRAVVAEVKLITP